MQCQKKKIHKVLRSHENQGNVTWQLTGWMEISLRLLTQDIKLLYFSHIVCIMPEELSEQHYRAEFSSVCK